MDLATRTLARLGDANEMLSAFGIEVAPGPIIVIADLALAERAYVHYSATPVALTAYAIASPTFARGRFPKTRLSDLVARRPHMDEREVRAFALVCGLPLLRVAGARPFATALHDIIARYELGALFAQVPPEFTVQDIDVRPRGVDWHTNEVDPIAMIDWRTAFLNLPPARQMLAATILWLYRGGPDKTWLYRLRVNWHAADAIATMRDTGGAPIGMLADWGTLIALFPGW